MLRLGGELASVRVEGETLGAGGGATNAVCLHRARAAGLGGFEFACAIPGTAGGGVWMNAGAYGSDWSQILVRARVVTADGAGWLTPAELGLSYRHSELRHGQVVAEVEYRLEPRAPDEIKADGRRPDRAAQGDPADEQAHVRQRLQEPRARARRGPDARGVRAQGTRDRRRVDLADARELHRERGRRDDRRRARADGRGAPPRPRAVRRRARARGRSCSARSRSRRKGRGGGETRDVAGGRGSRNRSRPRARAATAVAPVPARRGGRSPRAVPVRPLRPLPPDRLPILALGVGLYATARSTSAFAVDRSPSRAPRPRSRRRAQGARAGRRREPARSSTWTSSRGAPSRCRWWRPRRSTGPSRTRSDRGRPRGAGRGPPPGRRRRGSPPPAAVSSRSSTGASAPALPRVWLHARGRRRVGGDPRGAAAARRRGGHAARRAAAAVPRSLASSPRRAS